jgi:ribosomal RNA-processing protein 12
MVDSNVSPSQTGAISFEATTENIAFLRTQAESWLAVFFNVFSSVGRDARGMVGDVISAWAAIAGEQVRPSYCGRLHVCMSLTNMQEITKAHHKVVDLFKQNLAKSQAAPIHHSGPDDSGSVTAMTQDILILLLPHLSSTDATALFQLCLTSEILASKDNGVQKRGYKILAKLVESGKVVVDTETVLKQLDGFTEGLAPAAKKVPSGFQIIQVPFSSYLLGSVYSIITSHPHVTFDCDACRPIAHTRGCFGHQGTI